MILPAGKPEAGNRVPAILPGRPAEHCIQETPTAGRLGAPFYSAGLAGTCNPKSFITICKSFHVSFFCRGSRNKKAG